MLTKLNNMDIRFTEKITEQQAKQHAAIWRQLLYCDKVLTIDGVDEHYIAYNERKTRFVKIYGNKVKLQNGELSINIDLTNHHQKRIIKLFKRRAMEERNKILNCMEEREINILNKARRL